MLRREHGGGCALARWRAAACTSMVKTNTLMKPSCIIMRTRNMQIPAWVGLPSSSSTRSKIAEAKKLTIIDHRRPSESHRNTASITPGGAAQDEGVRTPYRLEHRRDAGVRTGPSRDRAATEPSGAQGGASASTHRSNAAARGRRATRAATRTWYFTAGNDEELLEIPGQARVRKRHRARAGARWREGTLGSTAPARAAAARGSGAPARRTAPRQAAREPTCRRTGSCWSR